MSIKINTIIYHNIFYTYTDIAFLVIADSRSRTILTAGYINIGCPHFVQMFTIVTSRQSQNNGETNVTCLKPR